MGFKRFMGVKKNLQMNLKTVCGFREAMNAYISAY